MSIRFSYKQQRARQPVVSLGGRSVRPRPIVQLTLIGPSGTYLEDSLLDTGADDTVFPEMVATKIGIDLSNAPTGEASGVGAIPAPVQTAANRDTAGVHCGRGAGPRTGRPEVRPDDRPPVTTAAQAERLHKLSGENV